VVHQPSESPKWPEPDQGLITAAFLDGKGGSQLTSWNEIEQMTEASGLLWMHLDYENERVKNWLRKHSGLDEITVQALLSEDPRPRSAAFTEGSLIVLRGVNMNEGADPEDMVSLRIWMEQNRIITLRNRRIMAANDIRVRLENQCGPKNPQEFLIQVTECLMNRIAEVILALQEKVDTLEEKVIGTETGELRKEIANLRRKVISFRRYLAPQRDAMIRMVSQRTSGKTGGLIM
jgi:zinc transporter